MPIGSRQCSFSKPRIIWALVILLSCWSAVNFAATPRWTSRGIGGGGALYSPSISPHDADRVYMATDMSAVFQSSDFGRGWSTVPFRQLRGGIASDVQFTSDPNVLYAVDLAGDARVPVKSTDGGLTFNLLVGDPTSEETYYLFADPGSTNNVLLSSYSDLYFSSNGGTNFSNVHSASDLHLAGAVFDSSGIFVGARHGVLLSTDGGTTFNLQSISGIPAGEAIVSFAGAREGGTLRFFAVTLGAGDVYPLVTGSEMGLFQGLYRLDWDGTPLWEAVDSGLTGGYLALLRENGRQRSGYGLRSRR